MKAPVLWSTLATTYLEQSSESQHQDLRRILTNQNNTDLMVKTPEIM